MSRWVHGRAVQGGVVRFLSASALEKADSSSSTGCLRAWWYRYLGGVEEPKSKSMEEGIKLHGELEEYLKTGSRAGLSSMALSGMHMLPPPGDDLLVEHSIVPVNPQTGEEDLALAPLRLHGIPVYGKIDLLHARGINYGTDDVEAQHDPPNTVEADDHKRVSSLDYIKRPDELPETIQMSIYGRYAFEVVPQAERVRLAHLYYPVRGASRKVSILVDREKIEPAWKRSEAIAVSIRDAARETNPDRVDANVRACRAYGRDCPARPICRAAKHNSLSDYLGGTAADRLIDEAPLPGDPMTQPSAPIPLIERLRLANAQPAATTPVATTTPIVPPAPPPPAPVPQAPAVSPEVQAEMRRLIEQQQAAVPAGPDLAALVLEISNQGRGFPMLAGVAAAEFAKLAGYEISAGAGLAGQGDLSYYCARTVRDLVDLLAILKSGQMPAAAQPTPVATAPAPAPIAATPSPVAPPPAAKPQKTAEEKAAEKAAKAAAKAAKAAAEEAARAAAQPTPVSTPAPPTVELQPPQPFVEFQPMPALVVMPQSAAAPAPSPAPTPAVERVILYVDCSLDGIQAQSLWPLINYITTELSNTAGGDYRYVEKFSYGKWKGAISAALRQCFAAGKIPGGNWLLDGANTETAHVVVETMRDLLNQSGGALIRGTR